MLRRWSLRSKILIGLCLLVMVVVILVGSGLRGMYAYRNLANGLRWRVNELPLAADLSQHISNLRITVSEVRGIRPTFSEAHSYELRLRMCRDQFRSEFTDVEESLAKYREQLDREPLPDRRLSDLQRERDTIQKIEQQLDKLRKANRDEDWVLDNVKVGWLDTELDALQTLAKELPSHLHAKLAGFDDAVQGQYRALILGTWITGAGAFLLFALSLHLLYRWIFHPLKLLLAGSRRVAGGEFDYRIQLGTNDEIAELGGAMNDMTERFQAIRDDLDRQVQERTKQVLRAEQMASVGFLAAGVAHEINNPLASIALCAESLESRIRDALNLGDEQHAVIGHYLELIQSEAFRCKGITEKLLDFSRIGPVARQSFDLGELVHGVIDMVKHVGKYRDKTVEFERREPIFVSINAQEIKQVVLNLLTNAFDSLDENGIVRVVIRTTGTMAELCVVDNGCGMTPEVLRHIFEPFFTRRKGGQGTGLGLSISYRIVSDHNGTIEGYSDGPGQGAAFRVRLPIVQEQKMAA